MRTGVEHDAHLAKKCIKLSFLAFLGLVKFIKAEASFLVNGCVCKSLYRLVGVFFGAMNLKRYQYLHPQLK